MAVADLLALHDRLIRTIQEREEAEGLEPAFQEDLKRGSQEIASGEAKGVEALNHPASAFFRSSAKHHDRTANSPSITAEAGC